MNRAATNFKKDVSRYCSGVIGAALLTLLAYAIVTGHWFMTEAVTAVVILALAAIQLVVQLLFFLHLDSESKPRWRTYSFLFTSAMLLIVVGGSLWIMLHLNYRMGMSGQQMTQYMIEQNREGF